MMFVYSVLCVLLASMIAAVVSMVVIAVALNVVIWIGELIQSIELSKSACTFLFITLIVIYMVVFGSLLEYHRIVEFPIK